MYAFFGTSRQIATGPSSALEAVAAGIFFQLQSTRDYEIEEYNRW